MEKFKFNKDTDSLFEAVLSLKTLKEAEDFFRDLCTTKEISEMVERWKITRLLSEGKTYREIAKDINTSTTTVGRVAFWLENGAGGYKNILNKISHHKKTTSSRKG